MLTKRRRVSLSARCAGFGLVEIKDIGREDVEKFNTPRFLSRSRLFLGVSFCKSRFVPLVPDVLRFHSNEMNQSNICIVFLGYTLCNSIWI